MSKTLSPALFKIAQLIHNVCDILDDDRNPDFAFTRVSAELCLDVRDVIRKENASSHVSLILIRDFDQSDNRRFLDTLRDPAGKSLGISIGLLRDVREALRAEIPEPLLPVPIDSPVKLIGGRSLRLIISNGPARPYWHPRLPKVDYLKPVR